MDRDLIASKILQIFNKSNSNISVLEQGTNINLQIDFSKFINSQKKEDLNSGETEDDINELFDENTEIERKKLLLARLSFNDEVKAYRAIEKYAKITNDELHEWAVLTLQQSRILMETTLGEENKIFISSGMGGIDNKIRFFGIFKSNGKEKFVAWQKDTIKKELYFTFPQYNSVVEEVNMYDTFVSFLCLIPINISIRKAINKVIGDCNEIGNFLSEDVFVTNVKKLTEDEITELIYSDSKDQLSKINKII